MSNKTIGVGEMFYSIQGESSSAGEPAIFLRKASCNLACGGWHNKEIDDQEDMYAGNDATWYCDSFSQWKEPHAGEYTVDELYSHFQEKGWLDKIVKGGAHIILTGGEPMMADSQQFFAEFLGKIDALGDGNVCFTEVETNGTIPPTDEFNKYVDKYNISLKLSNSGMDEKRRLNDEAMDFWVHGKTDDISIRRFKFVTTGAEEDIQEIESIMEEYDISDIQVSLMPAGASREELQETSPKVAEVCKEKCWSYSDRLQVRIWNKALGV